MNAAVKIDMLMFQGGHREAVARKIPREVWKEQVHGNLSRREGDCLVKFEQPGAALQQVIVGVWEQMCVNITIKLT
ncbi:hypothetical protein RRF57_012978 [Xylaria bambusicola]|uniref:Uncharacterized protein n=1 Tax=Xylaria bambusicola TaxID=326684 RepID=A0AAN7ZE00_9PEZI